MPAEVPIAEVDPEWLTSVLHVNGVLPAGRVSSVTQFATGAFNSQTSRLVLTYSQGPRSGVPTSMFLKRSIPTGWASEAGRLEVAFYSTASAAPGHPKVVPACYAADYDEESGQSFLLLEDLSESHAPPVTRDDQISIVRGVPRRRDIDLVVDALAQLHGYWWQHPMMADGLFDVGYAASSDERFADYLGRVTGAWDGFEADRTRSLPDPVRHLYDAALAGLPTYWETVLGPRYRSSRLTLCHGDTYFANFLCPRGEERGHAYLIDWQSPSFEVPGLDLANLCATFWSRAQRATHSRELSVLHRYHDKLLEYGMTYSWEDLCLDYRIGIIDWLLVPVIDAHQGSAPSYWQPKMSCLVAAFEDWDCQELIGGVR